MTKRLTIALVAVALFVLLAVFPASAATLAGNGTVINQTATIFIGEQGLNVTHALNQANNQIIGAVPVLADSAPGNLTIGWWASAAQITTTAPSAKVDLTGRYTSLTVAQSDFVGYTGNWYLLGADKSTPIKDGSGNPIVVFTVADPALDIGVWDYQQATDVTGKSVPQGEHLGFQIKTNMVINPTATPALRSDLISGTNYIWWYNGVSGNATVTQVTATYGTDPTGAYTNATVANPGVWVNYTYGNPLVTYAPSSAGLYTFTNTYNVVQNTGVATFVSSVQSPVSPANYNYNTATDGYINLKVQDESGTTLTGLYNSSGLIADTIPLTNQFVIGQPFYWPYDDAVGISYWKTDAFDTNNQYAYPVGTYTIWAESTLNNMKNNYKNSGADYTGKTISQTYTVSLVSDTVKIEANKDSVVRSKSFSVTITGKPSTPYYLWVKGTSSMKSGYDDQPPMVNVNQLGVQNDNAINAGNGLHPIGDYQYENGGGGAANSIFADVAQDNVTGFNETRYYGYVTLDTSGTRTVEFVTNNWTKAQKYTVRVEQNFPLVGGYGSPYGKGTIKSDEVDVNVEKGAVTIVAAGDQSYYLGEEIQFSGTNTETYSTYLFIIGPNLPDQGAVISDPNPRAAGSANPGITNNYIPDFRAVQVNGDNTWSWKWGTSNYALDAGTYTIYAVSQPYDRNHLANAAYGTVSIIIKKPFVSATASQSTVAKGDRIYITGTAEGQPTAVHIWVMGKNYATLDSTSVNSDASFSYEIKQETTKTLASGQYFVVVQHPMQNNKFDVDLVTYANGDGWVVNKQLNTATNTAGTQIFKLLGAGSLQGSDAAEALAEGINDANVDDTYTKLQFLIEEPVIQIDAIGDKHVGDKFTITASTNLAVDDEVLVQIYSSSFKPTEKSQSGEFSGATGTVKVTKGDSGMNLLSFDVDSSTFKPDEYIVTEDAVIQSATGTALFNVLDTSVPVVTTAAPVVTTAAPVVTTAAPVVTTAAPTATPTKSPGYGALIALIGLGAVAFIVVRRH
ncbi:MEMAR_RS02690 family S-layer glycoprotein [Methanoregula sp.]|uniref:MEMAR_RS02690 family S-layer glycoprotein n=1 Tax=Methanoregula sp. TaxID=2052170 RepID=UPI003C1F22BE